MNVSPDIIRRATEMRIIGARQDQQWTLAFIVEAVWRRIGLVIAGVVAALGLAALYLILASSLYTATTSIIPDTKRAPPSPAEVAAESIADPAIVESQIETIRSDKIALAVVTKLRLWEDPEFVPPEPGFVSRVVTFIVRGLTPFGLLKPERVASEDIKKQVAVAVFGQKLKVQRLGRSYVTEIAFTSLDPVKAATISNEIANAYIQDQLDSKFLAAQRTGVWMKHRIEELQHKVAGATQAVEEFKSRNNGNGGQDSAEAQQNAAKLRQLEADAQTQKSVYDSLVNRYARIGQFMQQQSLPITEARIVADATPPLSKSSPKSGLILVLATFMGGVLGVGGALAREYFDRSIRTSEQVEREVGIRCLGFLPAVKDARVGSLSADHPEIANETLRAVALAVDRDRRLDEGRTIGIVSPRSGDGKTTLASSLAFLLSQRGMSTLLIDGDLRDPVLTRSLSHNVPSDIVGVLQGTVGLTENVIRHELGFDLLGASTLPVRIHPSEILSSRVMLNLIDGLRKAYDYVIIDLPPMLERVDVSVCAPLADVFVLIVDARRTSIDDVNRALRTSDVVTERLAGIVVNRSKAAAGLLSV